DRRPAHREGRPPAGDYRPRTSDRAGSRGYEGGDDRRRDDRPGLRQRPDRHEHSNRPARDDRPRNAEGDAPRHGPVLPDEVSFSELDRDARGRLRTLSKDNAEAVGRHLVMVARLIDVDPELAYE